MSILGVMQRVQYSDFANPENNADVVEFLQDGSIVNLEDVKFYLAEK